jgi:hypothetical protein
VVTTKLAVPAGAVVHDNSGDSLPPGLPPSEQLFEPFKTMLLIMLSGKVAPSTKVVLLTWNELAGTTEVPRPCAGAKNEHANSRKVKPQILVFTEVSSLASTAGGILLQFFSCLTVAASSAPVHAPAAA